jgi:RHS repeat-associated protein
VDSKTVKYTLSDNLSNNAEHSIKVKTPLSDLSGKTILDFTEDFSYKGSDLIIFERVSESEHKESLVKNSYLFQGRSYNHITGLYYYRARYFHPELGRFIQADPMGYKDSMNMYQAFNQNPVNFVDPFGKNNRKKGKGVSQFLADIFSFFVKTDSDLKKTDWSYFYTQTTIDAFNLGTGGALNKTLSQEDLHWSDKIWFFMNELPNSAENISLLGLPENLRVSPSGFGGFIDAVERTYYNLTPINEINILFSNADIDQKIKNFGFGILKIAGYGLLGQWSNLKVYTNYRIRHLFNRSIELKSNQIFYSFKNAKYYKPGTKFGRLELWLTPELWPIENAANKLALPYSNYNLMLKVTMPKGSKILSPRRVWKLFGKEGGALETRNLTPITSDMYELINLRRSKHGKN